MMSDKHQPNKILCYHLPKLEHKFLGEAISQIVLLPTVSRGSVLCGLGRGPGTPIPALQN